MENDYRITKLHGTLIGDNRIPDLPVGEKTKIFSSTNGKTAWVDLPEGGNSLTLELTDFSGDETITRTSITEEEKTNLENGKYGFISYYDPSWGETAEGEMMTTLPQLFKNFLGTYFAIAHKVSRVNDSFSISGLLLYIIEIGEKNTDGTYPLTIEKSGELPFGGIGGGGNSLTLQLTDLSTGEQKTSLTEEEKTNLEAGKYGFVSYYDESWGDAAEYMLMFPQLLGCIQGTYFALIYNVSVSNDLISVSGLLGYVINIGEKNSDGMYPLTIEKAIEVPFAGGGGGGTIEIITATKTSDPELEEMGLTALKLAKAPTGSQFILSYNDNYILMTNIGGSYKGASFDSVFGSSIHYAYAGVDNTGNITCAYKYFDVTFLDLAEDETNAGMILTVKEHGGLGLGNLPDTGSSITIRRW